MRQCLDLRASAARVWRGPRAPARWSGVFLRYSPAPGRQGRSVSRPGAAPVPAPEYALAGEPPGRYYRTYVRNRAGPAAVPGAGPGGRRRPGRPGRAHPARRGQPDPPPPGGPAAGRPAARRGAAPGQHPDRRGPRRRRRPQRGPGPGGRRLGRRGRGARWSATRASGPWPPATSASTSGASPSSPAPGRRGPRPPPPCSRGSTWSCCARRSRPARPWPAAWWPGPASGGPCWWCVPGRAGWPEPPDLQLRIDDVAWEGVDAGEGHLRRRRMTVTATGRRSAARPTRRRLWLPDPDGAVSPVDDLGRRPAGPRRDGGLRWTACWSCAAPTSSTRTRAARPCAPSPRCSPPSRPTARG